VEGWEKRKERGDWGGLGQRLLSFVEGGRKGRTKTAPSTYARPKK